MTRTPHSAATASDASLVMACRLSSVNSRTRPPRRDSYPHTAVRLRSTASRSPAPMPALSTSPAGLRQAHCGRSRAAPEIQSAERPSVLRQGQKFLQIGESQVAAQATFGSFEVSGVLGRAALEALVVSFGSHLHAILRRS